MSEPAAIAKDLHLALALSGGGSRAIAFHLGCLRGLHRAGLLDQVVVISSVSGGSVIAALYCSHPGDFAAFERATIAALQRGFLRPALIRTVTSLDGIRALTAAIPLAIERLLALAVRIALLPFAKLRSRLTWLDRSPLRRWASRTTILRSVFDRMLGGAELDSLRTDRPTLIVVACELRARAAIYFTRARIQCWRYGVASAAGVRLSQAVAASAAYPAALPALDENMAFTKAGIATTERIILTDGGIYDNLGLAPFWPDRDPAISMAVPAFDRIIACRAGYGLAVSDPPSFFASRMNAVFESIFARAQNAAMKRLFDLSASGAMPKFLLPYIGQQDERLANPVPDLVSGEAAAGYPTNFSAMSDAWIETLSGRGETLVLSLLAEHWPELA